MKVVKLMCVLLLVIPLSAFASIISIENGDFEAALTLDQLDSVRGDYAFSAVGWTNIGNNNVGTFDPLAVAYNNGVADGRVGWSNGGTLLQTTSANFQAGNVYELSVDIGDRLDAGFPAGRIGIFAGSISNVVASLELSSPGNGLFGQETLTVDASDYGAYLGQTIGVYLKADGVQINFDNVVLSATSLSNVDKVSAPAVLSMFGLSIIFLAFRKAK